MDGTHASLRATRNPLSENNRAHVIDLLNRTLAAAIDLQAQAKQAHWNVRGPNFIAVHELFDGIAGALTGFVDQLAERVTALGGIALGTIQVAAKLSTLAHYPVEVTAETQHLEAVSSALGAFAHIAHEGIGMAEDLDDAVTADLLTQICGEVEKRLWFVESHLGH